MSEGWELSTKLKLGLYDPCMCVTEVEEEEEVRDRFKHLTHIDRNRHYIRSSSSREERRTPPSLHLHSSSLAFSSPPAAAAATVG